MVDTFERPHSSAFGAYSVTSHQRIQVLRLTLRGYSDSQRQPVSTAAGFMHHKRLMIDGIKRRVSERATRLPLQWFTHAFPSQAIAAHSPLRQRRRS